jgi:diguanylate cyclase
MIIESYAIYVVLPCAMLIFTIGYYLDRSRARDERKAVLTTLTTMQQSANQLSQDVDNHTSELSDMGRTVTDLDVSKEMGSVRQSLLGHIKDIISSNNKLEDDLVCARYTLQQQSLELDKTRMEMRVDALSQVGNRKAFDEALDYWLSKWNRHGERFALVICDIDHFKWINDTHGHRAGDDVVRGVGSLLKTCIDDDEGTFVARYGGDEFALLLKSEHSQYAIDLAKGIHSAAETHVQRRTAW